MLDSRSSETRVCALSELGSPGKKAIKLGGTRLLVLRDGGEVFAVENRCPHLNLPLSPGKFDGRMLTCPFHRARFDVRSGALDRKAFVFGAMGKDCLRKFDTQVRDGQVYVRL